MTISEIRSEISNHPSNRSLKAKGFEPLFSASKHSKIVIIGHAPSVTAQTTAVPWDDKSGVVLREWLGVADETFYNEDLIALMPMDFYYPGKGVTGDLPPRKDFAPMWHPQLLEAMPEIQLTILIGQHAQKHYLGKTMQRNLTETVRSYKDYLPEFLPIVHPSPLNFRWQAKNPWFKQAVIPELQKIVSAGLSS